MNIEISKDKKYKFIGFLGILSYVILYHLFYINHFLPPQEGWFTVMAHSILNGQLPYKDFHMCFPPLYEYQMAGIAHLLGFDPIIPRLFGVLERIIMCTFIYLLTLRITNVPNAIISSVFAFTLYANADYDLITSFLQSSILYGIIATYLSVRFLENVNLNNKNKFLWLFTIGVFTSLSFQFKQNLGLLISIVIPVVFALLRVSTIKWKGYSKELIAYIAGWGIPLLGLLAFLKAKGLFHLFVAQVFIGAAASKGSIPQILFGWSGRSFNFLALIQYLSYALVLYYIITIYDKTKDTWKENYSQSYTRKVLGFIAILTLGVILAGFINLQSLIRINVGNTFVFPNFSFASFVFLVSLFLSVFYFIKVLKNKDLTLKEQISFLLWCVSFSCMYALGMSYNIDPIGGILAFTLFVSFFYELKIPFYRIKNLVLSIVIISITLLLVLSRYQRPYRWWGWTEPSIKYATVKPHAPELRYFALSPKTAQMYDEIINLVKTHTEKGDNIYSFINIPIFYILTDRYPSTFTSFPHIDVYTDDYANKDAEELLKNPPKVIIYVDIDKVFWTLHEDAFRKGKLCGQRNIRNAIRQLVRDKKQNYIFYKKYNFGEDSRPGFNSPFYVWYKK